MTTKKGQHSIRFDSTSYLISGRRSSPQPSGAAADDDDDDDDDEGEFLTRGRRRHLASRARPGQGGTAKALATDGGAKVPSDRPHPYVLVRTYVRSTYAPTYGRTHCARGASSCTPISPTTTDCPAELPPPLSLSLSVSLAQASPGATVRTYLHTYEYAYSTLPTACT